MIDSNERNTDNGQLEWIESVSNELVEQLRADIVKSGESLEPITPSEALDEFIDEKERSDELAEATILSYKSRLKFFIKWCSANNIGDMNDVTGRQLQAYRMWREEGLSIKSKNTQQKTLRQFIRFCGTIEAVPTDLWKKVKVPSVNKEDEVRDEQVTGERAEEILSYLSKYHYASREHVVWMLLLEGGHRRGTIHALDKDDYYPDAEVPCLDLRHRPEEGTPLKNGDASERKVSISPDVCEVLDDYIADRRIEVADEHGREPLITSSLGRLSKSTIQKYIYKWTRPCATSGKCPHGKTVEECSAAQNVDEASKCPSSRSSHPVRRGYITHCLSKGVQTEVLTGRCDVTRNTLEKHYDARTEEEKMKLRNQILGEVLGNGSRFGESGSTARPTSD
ncbi:tyrosine-type recombinase/integrase [Natronosalvus halobius]|uniref:tyrosine-type recombinase/integrase n=1 Tax=Natronosalvus halobius TaxID=2953746 RepID=UPI0020A0DD1C|nr:site-specific integrase [Natronosalvus halobius]USZ71253.1 site-specific integrase [Natronosalvus halobius]